MDIDRKRFILINLCESYSKKIKPELIKNLPDSKIDLLCKRLNLDKYIQEAGVAGNILGFFIFQPYIWVAWRIALAAFSEHQKKCGIFTISNDRDICILQSKIDFTNKKIKILLQIKKEYQKKGKNTKQIDKKINDLKENIKNNNEKIQILKKLYIR